MVTSKIKAGKRYSAQVAYRYHRLAHSRRVAWRLTLCEYGRQEYQAQALDELTHMTMEDRVVEAPDEPVLAETAG